VMSGHFAGGLNGAALIAASPPMQSRPYGQDNL
jgi:hypothetical protein